MAKHLNATQRSYLIERAQDAVTKRLNAMMKTPAYKAALAKAKQMRAKKVEELYAEINKIGLTIRPSSDKYSVGEIEYVWPKGWTEGKFDAAVEKLEGDEDDEYAPEFHELESKLQGAFERFKEQLLFTDGDEALKSLKKFTDAIAKL